MSGTVGESRGRGVRIPNWLIGVVLLFVLMTGFLMHSVWLGLWGLTNDLEGLSGFYSAAMPVVTFIMFAHMITGAALSILAPLQLVTPIRRNWPGLHRWMGRVMVGLGLFTGFGGLLYAVRHGTTGGVFMDWSTSVYGILMLWAAVQTYRLGRAKKWAQHRRWGWRFSVLVIASWLYRMHYVVWDWLTGGLWTTPDMTGPFDKFQAWAFYLSYAAMLELWFLWDDHRRKSARRPVVRVPALSPRPEAPDPATPA